MNCPECGNELLIGSDVCPVCDMISEEEKQRQNLEQQKKDKIKKIIYISSISLILIAALIVGFIYIQKDKIQGNYNGNSENENLLVCYNGRYYYSTIGTLYSNNKKFSAPEIIDSTKGKITDLCILDGSLYYVKDNKLCKYNPKTRKIKALIKIEGDFSIAGFTEKVLYCNIGSSLYKFSSKTESSTKIVDANGLFCDGDLYIVCDNSLYKYNLKDKTRRQICNLAKYTIPAYFRDGQIICYDYKNCKMLSVNIDTCEIKEVLKTENFENISDITHLNIYKSYIFLRGENGIYRYNRANGDYVMLTSLGYMKYVIAGDNILYTVSHDNSAYFSDFDGKIQYTVESHESNKQ